MLLRAPEFWDEPKDKTLHANAILLSAMRLGTGRAVTRGEAACRLLTILSTFFSVSSTSRVYLTRQGRASQSALSRRIDAMSIWVQIGSGHRGIHVCSFRLRHPALPLGALIPPRVEHRFQANRMPWRGVIQHITVRLKLPIDLFR